MKQVIKSTSKSPVITSNQVAIKLAENPEGVVIYPRSSLISTEFAILATITRSGAEPRFGFVSLIGNTMYGACFISKTIEGAINQAASIGKKVYYFDSLEEFMQNKEEIIFAKDYIKENQPKQKWIYNLTND